MRSHRLLARAAVTSTVLARHAVNAGFVGRQAQRGRAGRRQDRLVMTSEPVNLAFRMPEPAATAARQRRMALHSAAFGGCIVACLLAASACGSGSAPSAAARTAPVTAAT